MKENQKKKERRRCGKLPDLVDIVVEPQLLDSVNAHVLGALHVKLRGSDHPTTHSTTPGEFSNKLFVVSLSRSTPGVYYLRLSMSVVKALSVPSSVSELRGVTGGE